MSGEIVIVGDVHLSEIDQAKDNFTRHYWGAFDYKLGDCFDGMVVPDDIIECTDYRELGPEPLLLPPGEAKNV